MRRLNPTVLVMIIVILLIVASFALSFHYWDELRGTDSAGAAVRNIGLVVGGLIAIVFALWRSAISQMQAEVAERDSLDGQFQKAASMLGHDDLFVRIGGVSALYYLGRNHLIRYGFQVCEILDTFSRVRRHDHEEKSRINIQRSIYSGVGTKKYEGPIDGGNAFDAFWDLQEQLSEQSRNDGKIINKATNLFQRLRS